MIIIKQGMTCNMQYLFFFCKKILPNQFIVFFCFFYLMKIFFHSVDLLIDKSTFFFLSFSILNVISILIFFSIILFLKMAIEKKIIHHSSSFHIYIMTESKKKKSIISINSFPNACKEFVHQILMHFFVVVVA